MTKRDVVQSHLEVLVEQLLETDDLKVQPDGDIGVEHDSAVWSARVRDRGGDPHIEVFSVVVSDVAADPGLYEALNDLNARLSHCRAFHSGSSVVVAGELLGETTTYADLACLAHEVAHAAHGEGPGLAATFGGRVARPDHVDDDQEDHP
ncbi:MAG: hypothetical protein JWO60_2026 [Frankiales bacterium]|nr:hypothetical protein [Frankiales bacterium]